MSKTPTESRKKVRDAIALGLGAKLNEIAAGSDPTRSLLNAIACGIAETLADSAMEALSRTEFSDRAHI